ncbi:MAG: prolyl oligopeptidase family serine peptidase [Candidatus Latescibacteria bacterium]|nr:prolyl oligopeptidase family serine peptidase [Candidatus Latescibacterota bacterium]
MKSLLLYIFTVVFLIFTGSTPSVSETRFQVGQHPHHLDKTVSKHITGGYLLFLPKDYEKEKKQWPTILFLHGAGERGDDLGILGRIALPMVLEERDDFPFIVISPQCPKDQRWSNEFLITLLDDIIAQYRVDTDRIYLTGLSMGGYGTWSLAFEYPDRFAALAPVCGGGNRYLVYTIKDVPVWVFHGELDTSVPVERGKEMVETLEKIGGNVKATFYPGRGHDCWHETYNDPILYEWFLQHSKRDRIK